MQEFFEQNRKLAIALSGGVDSVYLLYEAVRYGAEVKAYCVSTELQAAFELEDAGRAAGKAGAELKVIEMSVLDDDNIRSNPPDRCYHCKIRIMSAMKAAAAADGYELLIEGTNASDDADDRPGMRALAELGIRSPLRECGITKDEIRKRARELGIDVWDKPSYACLATRVPHGESVTDSKLRGSEKAESILRDMGFTNHRVRWRGSDALVELSEEQLDEGFERAEEIKTALGRIYDRVNISDKAR